MPPRAYVVACSWVLLALVAAHDVTHLVDGGLETSPGQLAIVAIPQWLVLAAVMAIVLRGDPAQRRAAALVLGLSVAAGFGVVHLLPFSPAAFWGGDLNSPHTTRTRVPSSSTTSGMSLPATS